MNSAKSTYSNFKFFSTSSVASDSSNLDTSPVLLISINTSLQYYSSITFIADVAFKIQTITNIANVLK
jgi:hypothetical protein